MNIKEGLEIIISIFLVILILFIVLAFPIFIFYYGYPLIYRIASFNIYLPSELNITLYPNQTETIYLPIKYNGTGLIKIIYEKEYNISLSYPQLYFLYGNSEVNVPIKISYYGSNYGNYSITIYVSDYLTVFPIKINVNIPEPYIDIIPLNTPWFVPPGSTGSFYIDVESNYNRTILIECISNQNITCYPSEIIGLPGKYEINISVGENVAPGEYYIEFIGEFYNGE